MTDEEKPGLGSLFGKAKKWLENEVKRSGDREEQEGIEQDMRQEAEQMRDDAIVEAILPGLQERKTAAAAAKEAADREDRVSRVVEGSRLTLQGTVEGTVESGLAVKVDREDGWLVVNVDTVDPVPLQGGTFTGLGFAVPLYTGPGRYDLANAESVEGMDFTLFMLGLAEDNEGYLWHPTYGAGVVTVREGETAAEIQFVYKTAGAERIEVTGTVALA